MAALVQSVGHDSAAGSHRHRLEQVVVHAVRPVIPFVALVVRRVMGLAVMSWFGVSLKAAGSRILTPL